MGLGHERLQHMISANLCMLRCTCVQTASSASLQLGLVTFTIYTKIMHSLLTGKEMYSFFWPLYSLSAQIRSNALVSSIASHEHLRLNYNTRIIKHGIYFRSGFNHLMRWIVVIRIGS